MLAISEWFSTGKVLGAMLWSHILNNTCDSQMGIRTKPTNGFARVSIKSSANVANNTTYNRISVIKFFPGQCQWSLFREKERIAKQGAFEPEFREPRVGE